MACVKSEQQNDPFQNFKNKEKGINDQWEDKVRKDIQNTVWMNEHIHKKSVYG